MRFTPKSAEEIAKAGLLPDGDYDFEVTDAEEATSKAGNEMIVLSLKVFDGDGGHQSVRDYLVSSDGGLRKIRGFAVATDLVERYETGALDASDMLRQSGRCKIKRDANPGYEPKNAVAYYLDPAKQADAPVARRAVQPVRQSTPAMTNSDLDDEIPF